MTEKSIEAIIDEAVQRFGIHGARVIHRIGPLQPMDQIVLVAVTASHRGMAFQACEYIMDYLKSLAPFWKRNRRPRARAGWMRASATKRRWRAGASELTLQALRSAAPRNHYGGRNTSRLPNITSSRPPTASGVHT